MPETRTNLDASFYNRHPKIVARELLGKTIEILRNDGERPIKAVFIETEAYGPKGEDSAVARAKGKRALSKKPGLIWIYPLYGGNAFSITTEGPGSVLVRGVFLEFAEARFKVISGPIKAASTLQIGKSFDETDLTQTSSSIIIYQNPDVVVHDVQSSNRVNLLHDTKENRRFFLRIRQDLEILRP